MKYYILFFILLISLQMGHSQCTDSGNVWDNSWTSCQQTTNPNSSRGNSHWILYEFTEDHFISTSHIWNSNQQGRRGRGIQDFTVDYSLDDGAWTELGTFNIPKANGPIEDYEGVPGPDFGSVRVDKILITVISTHGNGGCAAISEIQFDVDATQCHGVIDECDVCDGPGSPTWYIDADGDGLGSTNQTIEDCDQPSGYVANDEDLCDNGNLGWENVFPLFQNSCSSCHIDNVSGGLDLGSYQTFSEGGLKCGDDLLTGTSLVSVITVDGYNGCGDNITTPAMNTRSSNPMTDAEIALLQDWIDGGAPESCVDFDSPDCTQDFVEILSPLEDDVFQEGKDITVVANGCAAVGIEKMRFRVNGGTYFNINDIPYEYTFSDLPVGDHFFQVQMKDNDGVQTTVGVTVTVLPECPDDLTLSNIQSASTIYQSADEINSTQVIVSPAQVDYDAANTILLSAGFEVPTGATFHAYINGCIQSSLKENENNSSEKK